MTIKVYYHSRGGNTARLANAIADTCGCEAERISESTIPEKADIVFIGGAIYAFKMDAILSNFIIRLDESGSGRIFVFSTSASGKSIRKEVSNLCKKVPVSEDENYCRGQFMFFHKGRPNDNDIESAKRFAQRVIEESEE